MILNDQQIKALCDWCAPQPMIAPFLPEQVRRTEQGAPAISSGLSSYGYDIRLSTGGINRFVNPKTDFPYNAPTIDPKAFDALATLLTQSVTRDESGAYYTIQPHSYALGVSVETFHIPASVLGICYCKSTYARCGLMVNTTPLEPGWRGQLVIELANLTDLPMKVYANEGIAQVVFFEGDLPSVTYADRGGKYQDQRGIVPARI
jgi:dCTP deaminase